MKIKNINISQINHNNTTINRKTKNDKFIAENSSYIYSPLYYKDFTFNKKNLVSFKGTIPNKIEEPQSIEEFTTLLYETKKYSDKDINQIKSFINKIIESDEWKETDEKILFKMFLSLAESDKNWSLNALDSITQELCQLEKDDNYVEINHICEGICALCNNISYNDYRFKSIYTEGYNGFLDCSDDNNISEFCSIIKNSFKNVNTDKFYMLLEAFNKNIAYNDKNLENVKTTISEFINKYGFKDDELADAALMLYNDNINKEEIAKRIETRKCVNKVWENLNLTNVPQKTFFTRVYTNVIEELINRGYSPEETAALLSTDNLCNKFMEIENIDKSDTTIFADFIEDIPINTGNYNILYEYTKCSDIFNYLLSYYNGDISKIPLNKIITTASGDIFSTNDAISKIKELNNLLLINHLKRNLTLYRGEGIEVLNQIKLKNGKTLGNEVHNAVKHKDKNKLDTISAELIGSIIKQDRFMSTSYSKKTAQKFIKKNGGILWQIDVPKNANGIFTDPFNKENGVESEILLNRGYSLLVKDTEFKNDIYIIHADLIL